MGTTSEQMPWNYLPEDIILNIQKMLPVKSLCRFKCVSKPWCSMISSPSFLEMHHKYARQKPNLLFCKLFYHHELSRPNNLLTQWNSYETKSFKLIKSSTTRCNVFYSLVSCKGLVCFTGAEDGESNQIFIYNPSTSDLLALPIDYSSRFPRTPICCLGIGYVASSQTFKVLSLFVGTFLVRHVKCRIIEINQYDVTSPNGGKNYSDWRDVEDYCPHLLEVNTCITQNPTVIEDNIYWVTFGDLIVYFNVQDEKFGTLMAPNQGNGSSDQVFPLLTDLQGNLGFAVPSRGHGCYSLMIWKLQDNVWKKQYNISFEVAGYNYVWEHSWPVCVRDDEVVLYSWDYLTIYNTKTNSHRTLSQPRSFSHSTVLVMYHESLYRIGPQPGLNFVVSCDENKRPSDFAEKI